MEDRNGIFSNYLRSLEHTPEPTQEALEAVWKSLKALLSGELQRRGLWLQPTTFLGVLGSSRWPDSPEALDDLVGDVYAFIFLQRFESLSAHLQAKGNIEGLVRLNVRHFVWERQSQHDPLGTRVFTVLKRAVLQAVEVGELYAETTAESNGKKIGTSTVLRFENGSTEVEAWVQERLAELVPRWNDELLPALVVANSKAYGHLLQDVRRHIASLESAGVAAFLFGDLVTPLRSDLRARWSSRFRLAFETEEGSEGEDFVLLAPWTGEEPGGAFVDQQSLLALASCVVEGIAGFPANERTRQDLRRVWRLLLSRVGERPGKSCSEASQDEADQTVLPSQRQVSGLLGVSRDRVSSLYKILGQLILSCQAPPNQVLPSQTSGPSAVTWDERGAPPSRSGRTKVDLKERQALLRRQTAEVVQRTKNEPSGGGKSGDKSATSPLSGGVYLLGNSPGDLADESSFSEPPVAFEWVVLGERAEVPGKVWVIPADTHPISGRGDVVVPAGEPGGPLTLRCSLATHLPKTTFQGAVESRRLSSDSLVTARALAASSVKTSSEPEGEQLEGVATDWTPEYQEWMDELEARVKAEVEIWEIGAVPQEEEETEPIPFLPPKPKPKPEPIEKAPSRWRPIAAVLAIACSGLLAWNGILYRQLAQRDAAIVLPEGVEWWLKQSTRGPEDLQLLPHPTGGVVFISIPSEYLDQCEEFDIEIIGPKGKVLDRLERASPTSSHGLSVLLPRGLLKKQPQKLRVFNACDVPASFIEEKDIEVVPE